MNTQRWMSSQFFSFFVTWGVFLPYWTGWLVYAKGISVPEASLMMSLGLVIRGLSTLFMFPYLSGKFSSKTLLNWISAGTVISILCYIPANSFTSLLIVTLALHFFYPTLMPTLDSAASILVQNNQLRDYGKSRSWGSIGFVVAGMLLTIFTGALGDESIFWALLISSLIFLFLGSMRTPSVLTESPEKKSKKSGMLKLFKIKHFWIVLLIVILLQASHASYYNYGYIYLQDINATKYLIGLIINIAVIAEIIFFAVADRFFRNFSIGSLLALAALGSTIRWILVFMFSNVLLFSLTQTLHAFSFAMGHYAFIQYLIKNMPHDQIPQAQGLYSGLALSWSTAIFTIFGGYLYEIEPSYAFLGMIVCSIPSMLLALLYRKLHIAREA